MKYQLFSYGQKSSPNVGIMVDEISVNLAGAAELLGYPQLARFSVLDMIESWDSTKDQLQKLADAIAAKGDLPSDLVLEKDSLEFLPPLARTGTVYAAGANYRDHVEAMGKALNQTYNLDPKSEGVAPFHFLLAGAAVTTGHKTDVPYPPHTKKLDWEAELAVVIGRRAFNVSEDEALDYIAGYMCANDISARDYFTRENVDISSAFRHDWLGTKSFNKSCPLGPVFTPADFVESPEDLDIKLWVNDEIRQDSNTSNHMFTVADQIAYLSKRIDLLPGDIILTGTPAGAGQETGEFLQRGDVMKVWIDGLGELVNRIV